MDDIKVDLEAIKSRKLKIIYIFNNSSTNKERSNSIKNTICSKLISEFKYNFLSFDDCINDEIKNNTKLGALLQEKLKNEGISLELSIKTFIKHILAKSGSIFLIDWNSMTMEHAFYIEKNIKEINCIINFCEFATKIASSNPNETPQFMDIKDDSKLTEFYRKYGVVSDFSVDMEISKTFSLVKESLLPEVYCILGNTYSGKTTISRFLDERMKMTRIDFNQFISSSQLKQWINNDEYVISYMIKKLREDVEKRVIIENFPMKKEYLNLFVKNGKKFSKVIHLNCDKFTCMKRMKFIDKDSPDYVGSAKLNSLIYEYEKKKDLIALLKEKTNFIEINANRTLDMVKEEVIAKLKPKIYIVNSAEKSLKIKDEIIKIFVSGLKYEILDVKLLKQETLQRSGKLGQKMQEMNIESKTNKLILEMLRGILFNEKSNKYILVNFSKKTLDIKEFEENLCKIDNIVFVDKSYPVNIGSKDSMEVYFKQSHRLKYYELDHIDEYKHKGLLDKNRELCVVYGLPLSGKKKITEYLASNYGYKVLDFNKIVEGLKKRLAGPEGNPEEQVVDFTKFLEELKVLLADIPLNHKVIYQNIFSQIKDKDQLQKLLLISEVKTFFNVICNEQTLLERIKAVAGESAEPLSDEQKEETIKSWEIHKQFIEVFKSSFRELPINNSSLKDPVYTTYLNKYISRNFIVIKHTYDIDMEQSLYYLSSTHRVLIVNVPELIFTLCKDRTNKQCHDLMSTYSRKKLIKNELDCKNHKERIFYEYNPIHYSQKVVNEVIKTYISHHSNEIEESDNIVILLGYFNNDLLDSEEICFNLPLIEIQNLNLLGNIISYIQVSKEIVQIKENELPIELEQPKPLVKKEEKEENADGEVVDNEAKEVVEEENKEPELNEDGTVKIVYHPERYKWTFTDGVPRNYLQHLIKLFINKYQVIVREDLNINNLHETLIEYLSQIISNNIKYTVNFQNYLQDEKVLSKDVRKPRVIVDGKIILLVVK